MEINLLNPSQEEKGRLLSKWKHIVDEQTRVIRTWTSELELAWIAENATRCANWLELGSYCGRSAKVALLANPSLKITCLDTWDDYDCMETFKHHLRNEIADGRVICLQGPTQETIHKLEGSEFDGCWIDAGHTTPEVISDIQAVTPLMKIGSILSGHDYYKEQQNDVYQGVHQAVLGQVWNPVDTVWAVQ